MATINSTNIMKEIANQAVTASKTFEPTKKTRVSNKELRIIGKQHGNQIGFAYYVADPSKHEIKSAWFAEPMVDGCDTATSVLVGVTKFVNHIFDSRRKAQEKTGVADDTPVRFILEDNAAIKALAYIGCRSKGTDPMDRIAFEHYTETAISHLQAFVDSVDKLRQAGVDVYFQLYRWLTYWDLEVPEGVTVEEGEMLDFYGVVARDGIKLKGVRGLTTNASYKVVARRRPVFDENNKVIFEDGKLKTRIAGWMVARPNTSKSQQQSNEIKNLLTKRMAALNKVEVVMDDAPMSLDFLPED